MLSNNEKPTRVAVYCRVSSEEQAEANTIQNQVDYAKKYAELNSLTVHDFFQDEGVSGTIPLAEREQGRRLLAEAKVGKFNLVLVYRVDRLARRLRVLLDAYEALQGAGVGLKSMTEPIDTTTPIGRFVFQLLGSIAELERETIVERTNLGKRRVVREGKFPGGQPSMGYRVEGEKRNRKLVVEEAEAAIVREIFRLYTKDNMGLIELAAHLNAQGIEPAYLRRDKGRQGKGRWTFGTVAQVLRNTAYKGVYRWGKRGQGQKEIIEVPCPPLVPEAVWLEAQAKMRRNLALAKRNAKREYLLRGLITCGLCGHAFVGDGYHKRAAFYYSCSHARAREGEQKCLNLKVRAEPLEELVWKDIVGFVYNPGEVLLQLQEKLKTELTNLQSVENELAKLEGDLGKKQRERDIVIGLLRREVITYSEGERQLGDLAREIGSLQAQRGQLFARLEEHTRQEAGMLEAQVLLESLKTKVDEADYQTRRELVEQLVDNISVAPTEEAGQKSPRISVTYRFEAPEHRITYFPP